MDNIKLPGPVDLVFVCDTYHHMKNQSGLFPVIATISQAQWAGGDSGFSPAWVLFRPAWPRDCKEGNCRREMEEAGYRLIGDHNIVDSQQFSGVCLERAMKLDQLS